MSWVVANTNHFKRPDSPDPDLQLALHALNVVELNTFPPASPCRLAPEKKQLLCHSDGVAVSGRIATDVGAQASKGNGADDGLVGLSGAVTPGVSAVEATEMMSANVIS